MTNSSGSVNWNKVHAENYKAKAFWDIHWIQSAEDLLKSSEVLKPLIKEVWNNRKQKSKDKNTKLIKDHYNGPYFMLLAYALENYFKAGIVRKNSFLFKIEFEEKKKFPKMLTSHKLFELSKAAGYTLLEGEEGLLRRLTMSAVWYGRYPVPLDYRSLSGEETFSNGEKYSINYFSSNDVKRIDELVKNVKAWLNL